jgi:hypothetical protein
MGGDIEMQEASATYLHHDKYIEDVKADGHRDEEVTGRCFRHQLLVVRLELACMV